MFSKLPMLALSALPLASCVGTPQRAGLGAPAPVFDPATFFVGHSEGRGTLWKVMAHANPFAVHGQGRIEHDGTLVLEQAVEPTSGKPSKRVWRFHADGGGHWHGTLSSATSPVTGEVRGNAFYLRYTIKGGYRAEQWIFLQPGGDTALNRMKVTKLGMPVARIEETIRHIG